MRGSKSWRRRECPGCRRWACWSHCLRRCGNGLWRGSGMCGRWRPGGRAGLVLQVRRVPGTTRRRGHWRGGRGEGGGAVSDRHVHRRGDGAGDAGPLPRRRGVGAGGSADRAAPVGAGACGRVGGGRSAGGAGSRAGALRRGAGAASGVPGGCWPSGTASGRWHCRRLRRSTGWCTLWPTGAGCWALRDSAAGAAGSSVRTDGGDGAG